MERNQSNSPPYQKRHEVFVSLAHRLVGLTEAGRLSQKHAARYLGRFLIKNGTIRTTPIAKKVVSRADALIQTCQEDCNRAPECLTEHHEYWPRSDYQDPVSFAYRELPGNKRLLCESVHRKFHADKRNLPPDKPPHHKMVEAVLNCTVVMQTRLESEVESMLYSEPDNTNEI